MSTYSSIRRIPRAPLAACLVLIASVVVANGTEASASTFGTVTVSSITATTATVTGSIDPDGVDTTAWFAYSVNNTPPFSSTTPVQDVGSGTSSVPVSAILTGLAPDTTYYVQFIAESSSLTTQGPLTSFTTTGATAASLAVMSVRDSRAGVNLTAVSCPTETMCWAGGTYSTRSHSYGVVEQLSHGVWTPQATFDIGVAGMDCASTSSCWAVGYVMEGNNESPAAMHFNGRTWVRVAVPVPAGTSVDYFTAVTCPSTTSCWAVGGMDGASAAGRTLVEHYNGRSWSVVASPGPADDSLLNAVSCTSAQSCWAVGIADDFGTAPPINSLIEHWNGRTWTPAKAPNVHYGLTGVSCRFASSCFAIGSKLLQYSKGTWHVVPLTDIAYSYIACASATNCWETTNYGGETQYWNGVSWTRAEGQSPPSGQAWSLDALACAPGGTCFAVGDQSPRGVTGANSLYVTRALVEETSLGGS